MNSLQASLPIRPASSIAVARDNLLQVIEALMEPLVTVLTLCGIGIYIEGELLPPYLILSLILFSMTFPGKSNLNLTVWRLVRNTIATWLSLAFVLIFFGYATGCLSLFSLDALPIWLWVTPLFQIGAGLLFRATAPTILKLQGPKKRAVIVGMNEQGMALAQRIMQSRYDSTELNGFFEDRQSDRLQQDKSLPRLGLINQLPEYAKRNKINTIYLSLPMSSQPRILKLLDELKDTTASIYFVPDIFMTDLIQGRIDQLGGMPVVAVCETPFNGLDGALKRFSDILISLFIVILIFPVLLLVAFGVRISSPGPVIFKQRRYGLDGKEIQIYKFRSMTVCENGSSIQQAQREDKRITPFGAFLRKTSLDELPQFFNVLQGRMSIVGPRPHAVSHNELYRKLIKGYMIRHKVKPGITGWAQVNGLRGETETLEKMKARIDHDLDYLRNWSLRLDLHIILKTILVIFKDQNAY